MEGIYVAVRREEYRTAMGIWMGERAPFQVSTSDEVCFITGWRARLILRIAGLPTEPQLAASDVPTDCTQEPKA